MSDPQAYVPISCDFHDELEALSVTHKRCRIQFDTEDGRQSAKDGLIADIYTENHSEYLKFQDGFTIRLDRIRSVSELI